MTRPIRPEIGPSITHTGGVNSMTQIATEDTFVEVDGIRRKVVAGAPIPGYLAAQMEGVEQESVEARTLSAPVVDEEASKPQHERTQTTADAAQATIDAREAANAAKTSKTAAAKKSAASGSASGS